MNYLIDTNIISEVRKAERCDGHVAAWFAAINDEDIFLSVLVSAKSAKASNGRGGPILLKPVRSRNGYPHSSNRMRNAFCPSTR